MASLCRVRFINCSFGRLGLDLNSQVQVENLEHNEISAYMYWEAVSGNHILTINQEHRFDLEMASESDYTVVLISGPQPLLFLDDHLAPKPGTAHLRILDPYKKMTYTLIGKDCNSMGMVKNSNIYFQVRLGYNDLIINLCGDLEIEDQIWFSSGQITTIVIGAEDHALFSYEGVYDIYQSEFDVQRYMGTWHQTAAIPQFFNLGCQRSTAQYTFLEGMIKVHNTCGVGSSAEHITGKAEPSSVLEWNIPAVNPAALIVSFPTGMPRPDHPNYIVHATDYKHYALVGSSDRTNLYILSRQAAGLPASTESEILSLAQELGYDITKLVKNV